MSNDQQRGRVDRLKEWYSWLTEPEHVEKAPRRERWKRQSWMVLSTVVCLAGAFGVNSILFHVFVPSWPLVGVGFGTILAALFLDIAYVFPWGVRQFDLVIPWQFRDAEAKNEQ